MRQISQRMINKTHKPSEEEMLKFIGEKRKEYWFEIRHFVENNYDMKSEIIFWGKKHGWLVRYRKSGKTLCSLFPEKAGFTVLLVLGKKESEKALAMKDKLSSKTNEIIETTKQLHDGRWLWINPLTIEDTNDVKKILQIKRKPRPRRN